MFQRHVRAAICLALLCQASSLQAIVRSWDDEGGTVDKHWSNAGNWSPDGTPQTFDDIFIGNLPAAAGDHTIYDLPGQQIQSLSLTSGADVVTNGLELIVNGATTLSDGGTSLFIRTNSTNPDVDSLDTNTLTVNNGAIVFMSGGVLEVDAGLLEINAGGTLSGRGRVDLEFNSGGTQVLENSGRIDVTRSVLEPSATLSIRATGSGTIDLDGDSEAGVVDVDDETDPFPVFTGSLTLIIDGPLDDGFSGTMDIGRGDTVNFLQPWSIFSGFTGDGINFNGADGVATLTGAALSGPGFLNVNSGTGVFENDLMISSGNLVVAADATAQFDGAASISHDVAVQFEDSASLVINGTVAFGSLTNPMLAFDWDGIGNATTTVNAGATLIINTGHLDAADDTFDGSIHINGGDINVVVADGAWVADNVLNMTHTAVNVPNLSGSALEIGNDSGLLDADLNVGGAGESVIHSNVTFFSDADVSVGPGATLTLVGSATFNSGSNSNEFTGAGALRLAGTNTINEPTTINMTGGTVDLDNSDVFALVANNTTINAPLTINAATLADYGSSKTFTSTTFSELTIDSQGLETGALTVHLDDPNAEWTVLPVAIVNLVSDTTPSASLVGSDVNLNGAVNVMGDVLMHARVDIGGTVNINTAGEPFRLSGGNIIDPNTIAGGTVNGPGILGADAVSSLHGFGTIGADIDFDSNAELRADNGTLTINSSIIDVGVIGTADDDGVLNVTNPWSTFVASSVELRGGRIEGANITNAGGMGIAGFGEVTAQVNNITRIHAEGGTLRAANAANDWDGSTNVGSLSAFSGALELVFVDNAVFPFRGTVLAISGDVFVNGFELDFEPESELALIGGVFRSTHGTRIAGAVTVNVGGPSTISVAGAVPTIVFENGSNATLHDDLKLDSPNTVVEAGATFSGSGKLVNLTERTMTLADGADVGVVLENMGVLALGASPGQVQAAGFQQGASGTLQIELMGAGLDDFDSLDLTGPAQLAGTLDLSLLGGFSPGLGDAFKIILADGGVTGSFTSVHQPAGLPAGLIFDVIYTPTQVQLQVVNCPIFSADFDCDGDVDGDDLAQWQGDFGMNALSDADGDGDSDGTDFLTWQRQVGSGAPASNAAASVPEPRVAGMTLPMIVAVMVRKFGQRMRFPMRRS